MRYFAFVLTAVLVSQFQVSAQDAPKKRVLITDSHSWEMQGGFGGTSEGAGGSMAGGARPQTVEIMKTFQERCPGVVITRNKSNADFIVLWIMREEKG